MWLYLDDADHERDVAQVCNALRQDMVDFMGIGDEERAARRHAALTARFKTVQSLCGWQDFPGFPKLEDCQDGRLKHCFSPSAGPPSVARPGKGLRASHWAALLSVLALVALHHRRILGLDLDQEDRKDERAS